LPSVLGERQGERKRRRRKVYSGANAVNEGRRKDYSKLMQRTWRTPSATRYPRVESEDHCTRRTSSGTALPRCRRQIGGV
jgi:hypothetical protein